MAQKAKERSWLFDKDTYSMKYFEAIKLAFNKKGY